MISRRISSVVKVGNLLLGGDNPIRVQSMTTTNTNDTAACVAQAKRIIDAGGELVRLTTQGRREAENMQNIGDALKRDGYNTPLVADVHFNANVADIAAQHCEKVRVNPGNYVDPARKFIKQEYTDEEYASELRKIDGRFTPFLNICKEYGTAIRIGVNHGSLSDRIRNRYGDTPKGIVESCLEFLRICKREHFDNVVLSIKASNTVVMVQSVRLLVQEMDKEDMHYPLHLGVTEAGEGEDGRIKSAVGIGALLTEGIGDTIRVSLSEEPECEIPVARKLVSFVDECAEMRQKAHIDNGTLRLEFHENDPEDLQLKAAMAAGALLIDGKAHSLVITNNGDDKPELADAILQAARVKFTKTEFISCPGCGRTLYNLQGTIAKIKSAIKEAAVGNPKLNSLKIGIMGCIVNGPGEMADADFGYVGAGPGKISLYRKQECVETGIPEDEAVDKLLKLIDKWT
jgi:1-hydroxy-2-methyl-2-(E)-butenyl 4-diphosphate synthase